MNKEPLASKLVLWDYTVCVQYPGEVPLGATVSVYCRPSIKTPFRYVIVQLPSKKVTLQFCELEVFARGVYARHMRAARSVSYRTVGEYQTRR